MTGIVLVAVVGAAAAWSLGFFALAVAVGLVVQRARNPRK
jgi:hypothetical protein